MQIWKMLIKTMKKEIKKNQIKNYKITLIVSLKAKENL